MVTDVPSRENIGSVSPAADRAWRSANDVCAFLRSNAWTGSSMARVGTFLRSTWITEPNVAGRGGPGPAPLPAAGEGDVLTVRTASTRSVSIRIAERAVMLAERPRPR